MSATPILRHARAARPFPTLRRLFGLVAAADARYRQRQDLRALDDHLLRDIGISRGDIDGELRRSARW